MCQPTVVEDFPTVGGICLFRGPTRVSETEWTFVSILELVMKSFESHVDFVDHLSNVTSKTTSSVPDPRKDCSTVRRIRRPDVWSETSRLLGPKLFVVGPTVRPQVERVTTVGPLCDRTDGPAPSQSRIGVGQK